MLQPSSHVFVSGELTRIAGRWCGELGNAFSDEFAQPNVAEVHQLGVLNISEVGRISQYGIEAFRLQIGQGCIGAGQFNFSQLCEVGNCAFVSPIHSPGISTVIFLPPRCRISKGSVTVGFRLNELGGYVGPAAASDIVAIGPAGYSEKVGFALDETDGKTVNEKICREI